MRRDVVDDERSDDVELWCIGAFEREQPSATADLQSADVVSHTWT
jgi:hypothetical protein